MSTSPRAQKNLGWLWYFVLLAVLAVSATIVLIVYNQNQQLRPDQIAAAQERWRKNGPRSYRLVYNISTDSPAGQKRTDYFDVTVRDGVVTRASLNEKALPAERLSEFGMDKLLAFVADKIAIDQERDRPRTFTRAMFDDQKTGALIWYIRRVMGSKERVEIKFEKIQ